MMLDLGEYQEESVNIIAIMGPHGVYHKDEPIKELEAALQRRGFQTIWPQNSADLLQFIEHNPRICGVIFDWDEYSVDLCSDINQLNEYLPLYAFINAHSTMDVSSQDLRMTLWFFEYALGLSEEIATRIGQYTREYRRISLRRLPARCSTMSVRENIPSVRRAIWAAAPIRKARWAACSMIFWREYAEGGCLDFGHRAGLPAGSYRPAPGGGGVYRARLWRRAKLYGDQRHLDVQ